MVRRYRRVARAVTDLPGGIPDGWTLRSLEMYGDYPLDRGE